MKLIALSCAIVSAITVMAQGSSVISGIVTDSAGEPLVGVNIVIKGAPTGVATDIDGKYEISIGNRSSAVITFSYVGMKNMSVNVTGETKVLNVKMEEDNSLDAVIIQGYGRIQKKDDMVGSAYQVNSKDFEYKPLTRIDNILDGMVPGLSIEPNTDSPTTTRTRYNTRIRGEASLSASNEPLWIIDGVPVYTGTGTNIVPGMSYSISPLTFINPDDIASFTVLKDASGVSIYGADGANGVILVTTKSGMAANSAPKVSASFRYGISSIDESTRFKVLNAAQYMAYAKEAWVNGGNKAAAFPFQDNDLNTYSTTDTDWHDQYFGVGNNILANVSISSGGKTSSSYFSASYYKEKGSVKGNTQQRFSARLNNTYKFGKRFTFRPMLSASYNINKLFSPSYEYYEALPIYSPYDNDGFTYRLYNRYISSLDSYGNPVWKDMKFFDNTIADRDLDDNTQKAYSADANFVFEYKVINGLTATVQFGSSYQHSYETMYYSRETLNGLVDNEPEGYSSRASANFLSWTNIDRLNYDRFFGKHHITALAGTELSSKGYNTLSAYGYGFINDHIQELAYSESDSRSGTSSVSTTRKLSFLGQAAYTYDSRYTLQASVRREGCSSFGKYAKWDNYFSIGGAWNINKESFFSSRDINLLKLKASFGTSGNSRVSSAQMKGLGIFSYGDSYSYNGEIGGVVSTPANPGISWETTYMTNAGVDVRMWKRLSVSLEGYYNYTTNLLSKIYTSRVIGDQRIYGNIGEISNTGVELTVNSTNIDHKNFRWNTDFNLSHNRNRVEKLADDKPISYGTTVVAEGHDSDSFYLVRWAGVDSSTGAPMWYDKDGNLTYNYSTADRVIDKSSTPTVSGGMSNTFELYDFALTFQLNYSIGGYSLCSLGMNGIDDGYGITDENVSINSLDHWSRAGDVSANPRISTISSSSGRASTRFLYNKTNIRLQNLALSYNIPLNAVKSAGFSSCKISLIADNLYLWTPDQKHNRNSYKTMMYGYPVQRTISLSLDFTL
jgi:TonB-linked SusC/RagA family outer membrane protein